LRRDRVKLTFLGAAKTVTGSKYLIESKGKKYLLDCGLFQGYKELRLLNWDKFAVTPATIDAIILTHAHIDHSGYIPRLYKEGFRGKIYCTRATRDLCEILLLDSAHLQEEDARRSNRYEYTKHKPALPLYDTEDVKAALKHFRAVDFHTPYILNKDLQFTFHHAGHILGSAWVLLTSEEKTILFSGDLGRSHDQVMQPPESPLPADYLVLESTYGNRLHEKIDPSDEIKEIILSTSQKGGGILIPAFAVGRTQSILYYIYKLKQAQLIPSIPVYIDSPMATSATELFCQYDQELRLSKAVAEKVCDSAIYVRDTEASKKLNALTHPRIIISASGMATGGRVLHHLKNFLPKAENTVLFSGFQAGGTRGDRLVKGEKEIKIHGEMFAVRARIENLTSTSAHADYAEILKWLEKISIPPKKVFITHGEQASAQSLREKIEKKFGWNAVVPHYLQQEPLN
jgi:metallo-beta-lactamase family protein